MGFKATREEAPGAAREVRSDFRQLVLVLSEECQWEPVQRFDWFTWDLAEFKVEVPTDKKTRIKEMARELMDSTSVSARHIHLQPPPTIIHHLLSFTIIHSVLKVGKGVWSFIGPSVFRATSCLAEQLRETTFFGIFPLFSCSCC